MGLSGLSAVAAVDAVGHGLTVEFVRGGDRVAHQIRIVGDNRAGECLARSIEAADAARAEATPALQELHIETIDGVETAFLVGMSGANHWSLTVQPQIVDGAPRLLFDEACRVKEPLGQIERGYALAANRNSLTWEGLATPGYGLPTVAEADQRATVTHSLPLTAALPWTARWRYAVRLGRRRP